MDIIISLIYLLFVVCVVYPPAEFISAGFTITELFRSYLGSENTNFVEFHMKRITITALIHSALPLGYVLCLWCSGATGDWLLPLAVVTSIILLLMCSKVICWWEYDKSKHPGVKALLPYVESGSDWRVVASDINVEFWSVDKVSIPLTAVSKFIATESWLIKVSQYSLNVAKQQDCALVATATDSHELSTSGDEEVQYVNLEAIPARGDVPKFSLRLTAGSLRELSPRLAHPVQLPDHIALQPTVVERFVDVFRHHVSQNPVVYLDEDPEPCIGCMTSSADVKLRRICLQPPAHLGLQGPPVCETCNCRALWCVSCMARWWAARASGPQSEWLSGRCTCPVCRARFCLLDVCPTRRRGAD